MHHFKRIARYLFYFWRAKKQWSWPNESEVLIFDACGEELLREHLLDWSVEVLPVRGESVNIPVTLASLFVLGNRSDAYLDVYIRRVKPKLALTFIDNTVAFYRLARRHPGLKTMFVQNGWRGYHVDVFEQLETRRDSADTFAVDYMLCFGQAVGKHYQRFISGAVVTMGALRNNRQPRDFSAVQGSIVFVSQWHRDGINVAGKAYSQDEFIGAVDRCLLGFLGEYARHHGKRLYIIPRTQVADPNRADEAQHFSSILGESCCFLETDLLGSSYRAVDKAEVVVGVDSTLLYEAAARGVKTAFFSIRGSIMGVKGFDFGWPAQYPSRGGFWTNTPSSKEFEKVLDYLIPLSDDAWSEELRRASFAELMIFDQGNLTLKKTLAQAITA